MALRDYSVKFLAIGLCFLLLASCSTGKSTEKKEAEGQPVEVLYNRAAAELDVGNYAESARLFEEVERQYPYSQWATQAELMGAYSHYENGDFPRAIVALDRFVELHPGNKNVDYAYYLRAITLYEQISDVRRDQSISEEALAALDALVRRFPDSRYARDATLKRDLVLDHLAGKEMEIGRYYLKRGEINAAINRFLAVVEDYQTTTHVPEALHRLVEAYVTLGLKKEGTRVAAVLGHNYPGSEWYQRSYALLDDAQRAELLDSKSFLDRTVDSLLK